MMIKRRKSQSGSSNLTSMFPQHKARHPRTGELIRSCLVPPSQTASDNIKLKQKVKFGKVTVTQFQPTIGDNPACTSGCPIALQPQHCAVEVFASVSKYQRHEIARRPLSYGRKGRDLMISRERRRKRLDAQGYSEEEMAQAATKADGLRKQRMETMQANKAWDKMFKLPKYIRKSLNAAKQVNGGSFNVRKSSAAVSA
uniref:Uncharacterized protein n=1 Tax=Craspedostauros australis TaxID=1486917 RepID=A0A7R9ZM83_9STRA|mmetsp:Transcript_16442/g.45563  ORF Transcript_16442/g.45563 Transcript_16442/m.45563 type:complete len:199 (+) Transcript_16442:400-996(+)|eukprot:CAMPEP_0198135532 /NCGR_PEP_ID=MMETSP1442-20131203/60640_1 /TAXON_ID= /ORGANISM="Craspedostauros australis, Strain CCMP3328" /LENGTH=198 /DNA_ID=CAMNT_0043796705 /DNA_START=285 /DNA_END=881 /DNA_ORIENTATION=+